MKIPFVGPAYQSRAWALSVQECTNWYPEINEGTKEVLSLQGTPGLRLQGTVGEGPIHGMYVMPNERWYVVSGQELYRCSFAGGALQSVPLGEIVGNRRVSMSDNGTQLCIVNGVKGYICTGDTLQAISDEDFWPADNVDFLSGYFVFNRSGTGQFFISGLYEGTSYDPLEYATAEAAPDNTVGILVDHNELWLFGRDTTEIWGPSADIYFPYARLGGGVLEYGSLGPYVAAPLDGTVVWVGSDRIVWRARSGYNPERISTHAIESAIGSFDSSAFAFSYSQEGHHFYVLTNPSGESYVYDASTGMWHRRQSYGLSRYRANCLIKRGANVYVGDHVNGNIYRLDLEYGQEGSDPISRVRTTQFIHDEKHLGQQIFMDKLEVDMETGTAPATGTGTDPQAMLQYSDDKGHTWSNEQWASMGQRGEHSKQVVWDRLGSFRSRAFRLTVSSRGRVAVLGATARGEYDDQA